MNLSFKSSRTVFSGLSLCVLLSVSPVLASNSMPSVAAGAKILRADLPANETLSKVDCETLARAVHRTTMLHRSDAAAIFLAALTGGEEPGSARAPKRACACITRLFHAAYTAAPAQAAPLLEQAAMLYPDCADELQKMVLNTDDKNPVAAASDDKNPVAGANSPGSKRGDGSNGDSNSSNLGGVPDGASAIAAENTDLNNAGGFGVGFGPGVPGSPGFVGSAPGGGIALPPASPNPVTSVVNE